MKYLFLTFLLVFCFNINAQDSKIVEAFDSLVLNSNSWTKYRVIKKNDLSSYKSELIQNTESLKKTIVDLNSRISNLEETLEITDNENKAFKNEVQTLKTSIDEISVLGISLSKSTYSLMVWSIILVLVLVLTFLILKLRNRTIVTQEVKENLESTTKEFEEYKHRAIEKQQKLGRDLLDAQKLAQSGNTKK